MNDTLKWILLAVVSMVAIIFATSAIGLDWAYVQSNILSLFVKIGLVLILFTGSAAAVEIAKYYRAQNRSLNEHDQAEPARVEEAKLRALVQHAVEDAMSEYEEPSRRQLGGAKDRKRSVHPDEPSRERIETS